MLLTQTSRSPSMKRRLAPSILTGSLHEELDIFCHLQATPWMAQNSQKEAGRPFSP